MAIRLRTVDGIRVALCAARSISKENDIYLDDSDHYALAEKFWLDYKSETCGCLPLTDERVVKLIENEESNNCNRNDWDEIYGK